MFSGLVTLFGSIFLSGLPRQILVAPFGIALLGTFAFIIWTLGERERIKRYRLPNLAGDEKEVLKAYIKQDKMTIPFVVADAKPKSLSSEGILFLSPDVQHVAPGFIYYTIHFWAFDFLKKHPDFVGLPRLSISRG